LAALVLTMANEPTNTTASGAHHLAFPECECCLHWEKAHRSVATCLDVLLLGYQVQVWGGQYYYILIFIILMKREFYSWISRF